ncbi:MAG: primosomal protein N' [Campylobacteraceae bacterium]|nr:primosomal protein N' [Campylobacteraceae bacterium]
MTFFYYEVCLLKSPLSNLTYKSAQEIKIGSLVTVPLRNRKNNSNAVVIEKVEKPTFKCIEIAEITQKYYDSKMIKTAKFVSLYYVCSLGEALSVFTPFYENNEEIEVKEFISNIDLSTKQEEAYNFLQDNRAGLLFANTGSGKTEIYIKTIEKHLNNKEQALLLMPEISLTPQMQKRLEEVFGSYVAIWHSKVSKKKKEKIIDDLLCGKVKLIAGARSSLFLPFSNLGLIVVDEEHDESYKSDQKPRFHTKDLALYIAQTQKIQIILGSATPSTASFFKLPYFRLKETFFKSNKKITYFESDTALSPSVLTKITQALQNDNQVIVFLPTRANFKYQICTSCGKSVQCPYCSVAMSLHKNALALKCHYCGYAQMIPSSCPTCKHGIIHNLRVGTAQIEEELNAIYTDRKIMRFDRDEITTDTKLKKVLNDFNEKKIDILVGTQMLSKGHDYHNVTLAVVLGMDSVLNMNSYKAREQALSLLIQIAGRSGRKGFGEVIIQTKNEDFFDYYLSNSDYEDFLKDELEFREELYPPYLRMAKIVFAHTNGFKVKQELDKYITILKQNQKIEVVGFGECAIFKIANRYRYEIIIRSASANALLNALHGVNSPLAIIDMDTIR